jgi:catechol 2,3-dioxygenase
MVARHADGTPSDGREPLDVEALLHELIPQDRLDQPMPPDTIIGHVHLYVADLDQTMHFYHQVLGFDNMGIARDFRRGMVSAGGYHHHIGFNTWIGEGARLPAQRVGLRYLRWCFQKVRSGSGDAALEAGGSRTEETGDGILVRDPAQNGVMLTTRVGKQIESISS